MNKNPNKLPEVAGEDGFISVPHAALSLGYSQPKKFRSMVERIENSMGILADLIAAGDTEYLPLFERLEKELDKYRQEQDALNRAIKFSKMRNET